MGRPRSRYCKNCVSWHGAYCRNHGVRKGRHDFCKSFIKRDTKCAECEAENAIYRFQKKMLCLDCFLPAMPKPEISTRNTSNLVPSVSAQTGHLQPKGSR